MNDLATPTRLRALFSSILLDSTPAARRGLLEQLVRQAFQEVTEEATLLTVLEQFVFLCSARAHEDASFDQWGVQVLQWMHEQETEASFVQTMTRLQNNVDVQGHVCPLLDAAFFAFITEHAAAIDTLFFETLASVTPYRPTIFGWRTLFHAYLMKSNGKVCERPAHLWFRVALFLHTDDWAATRTCFADLLRGHYTHATPTLFYAGARRPQMASCFTADTRVLTRENGWTPIADVPVGYHVLTHRNRWRPVAQVHANARADRALVDLTIKGHRVGTCTDDHPFWTWSPDTQTHTWQPARICTTNASIELEHVGSARSDPTSTEPTDVHWWIRGVILSWASVKPLRNPAPFSLLLDGKTVRCLGVDMVDAPLWSYLLLGSRNAAKRAVAVQSWLQGNMTGVRWWALGWKRGCALATLSGHREMIQETGDVALLHTIAATARATHDSRDFRPASSSMQDVQTVHTLGVVEDHSYVIEGGFIAKNCFLVGTEDSVAQIFKTVADVAQISKWAGGLGIHISNVRANRSYIYGTNGRSNGILPMIRIFNDTSRYIDQCFSGDTLVYCATRGWTPIRTVQCGDRVLNRSGRPTRVARVRTYTIPQQRLLWAPKGVVGVTTEHDMLTRDGTFKSMSEISPSDFVSFPQPQEIHDYAHMDEFFFQLLGYAIHAVRKGVEMTFDDFRQFVREATRLCVTMDEEEEEENLVLPSILLADLPMAWIQSGCKDAFPTSLLHLPVAKLDWLVTYTPAFVWSLHPLARRTIQYRRAPPPAWKPVSDLCLRHDATANESVLVFDLQVDTDDPTYLTELGVAHNGGGKRNGAFAMYLEPWHADVLAFLHAKRSTGAEEERARDLFYGLWIPDLFMKRVEADATWSLMCPSQSPGLYQLYGKAFEEQYERYEREGKFVRQMPARELWVEMVRMQVETGTPYMLFKDSCNAKSNQQNLGTIRSSNLCTEIIEYSDHEEYAVCNLASIALPKCLVSNAQWERDKVQEAVVVMFARDAFLETRWLKQWITEERPEWTVHYLAEPDARRFMALPASGDDATAIADTAKSATWVRCAGDATWRPVGPPMAFARRFLCPVLDAQQLHETTRHVVHNLNQVIDKNVYPVPETERSNRKHRPIGIGVQGLADVFAACRLPFDGAEARDLHRRIFETIYHAAMTASVDLAVRDGPYASFAGSPLSQGRFHFDLCPDFDLPLHWDWDTLRARVQTHGARNSLLVAPMPTASTSQILGNNECFEPYTANLYLRRTLSGEFYVVNRFLRDDLRRMGRWNRETVDRLLVDKGSVQSWSDLSADLRQVYRTVWEISPKSLLDMAHERHFFIDQSQSLNVFLASTSLEKLSKMHFYAWKKGLKTGCYYVRVKPIVSSPHVTVNAETTCTSCSA